MLHSGVLLNWTAHLILTTSFSLTCFCRANSFSPLYSPMPLSFALLLSLFFSLPLPLRPLPCFVKFPVYIPPVHASTGLPLLLSISPACYCASLPLPLLPTSFCFFCFPLPPSPASPFCCAPFPTWASLTFVLLPCDSDFSGLMPHSFLLSLLSSSLTPSTDFLDSRVVPGFSCRDVHSEMA